MPKHIIGYGAVQQDVPDAIVFAACELWSDGFGRVLCEPITDERFDDSGAALEHLLGVLNAEHGDNPVTA